MICSCNGVYSSRLPDIQDAMLTLVLRSFYYHTQMYIVHSKIAIYPSFLWFLYEIILVNMKSE